ncbi:hypothetical protein Fmac_030686 [Flemingia macrophylla]|uniref:Magnesium transporter CorA-like family protein n=1 Tax=Flemingia macrophylla TaxID=520843 RepID=A0ABD1KZW9_9FABA
MLAAYYGLPFEEHGVALFVGTFDSPISMVVETLVPLLEGDMRGAELWTDGLICAFEFVREWGATKSKGFQGNQSDCIGKSGNVLLGSDGHELGDQNHQPVTPHLYCKECPPRSYWRPIGCDRISELVREIHDDEAPPFDFTDDESDVPVAIVAIPYWEWPVEPTWWCHMDAADPFVTTSFGSSRWLHPAISIALQEESRLISDRMKHLLYEVPVRVAGGLLFELLGQSVGDPFAEEDDIPSVLRAWQAQNFLVTALHVKGSASKINVLGILEVQELLAAGGANIPRSIHEVVAHLACRLARWDDRCETAMTHEKNKKNGMELNRLRGNATRALLEGAMNATREMIEGQEAVRDRLFTIQDVMQSTVRAWLQDRSLAATHNLRIFGGCGLIIITGLFGINVDGIPGSSGNPDAFLMFSVALFVLGVVLIGIGLLYLGLKKPIIEENVALRKLELQELVRMFEHEAETHAQERKKLPHKDVPQTATVRPRKGAKYRLMMSKLFGL